MPRVAVVVATWNRRALLAQALASATSQSFADLEVVVADDGSTDGTADEVASVAARDPRVSHLPLPRSGFDGKVRNAAIRATSAPLVAFLDDDDLWLPGKLERQVALLDGAKGAALTFGRVERFGDSSGVWPRRPVPRNPSLERLLRGNFVPLSTVLARREALVEAGLFREDVVPTADYELWLDVARRRPILADDAVLARYRVHGGSLIRRSGAEAEALARLHDRLEREWGLPRRLLAPARRGVWRLRARTAPSLGERLAWRLRSLLP